MKYIKPEIEIEFFDKSVMTGGGLGVSGDAPEVAGTVPDISTGGNNEW